VRAYQHRYGKLIEEIENDILKGNDGYPRTPTEAYSLLVNYKNYANTNQCMKQPGKLHFCQPPKEKTDKTLQIGKD
jgi:hypothetical protein